MSPQKFGLFLMLSAVYLAIFGFIGAKLIDYLYKVTRLGYETLILIYCLSWGFFTGLAFYLIG